MRVREREGKERGMANKAKEGGLRERDSEGEGEGWKREII